MAASVLTFLIWAGKSFSRRWRNQPAKVCKWSVWNNIGSVLACENASPRSVKSMAEFQNHIEPIGCISLVHRKTWKNLMFRPEKGRNHCIFHDSVSRECQGHVNSWKNLTFLSQKCENIVFFHEIVIPEPIVSDLGAQRGVGQGKALSGISLPKPAF